MASRDRLTAADVDASARPGARVPRLSIDETGTAAGSDREMPVGDDARVAADPGTDVQLWQEPGGRLFGTGRVSPTGGWIEVADVATFAFARGSDTVRAVPRPGARPEAIRRAYERAVLPLVLHALDTEVLHASAVLGAAGLVAFCGESGAGKSTTARGLEQRGHRAWADDAVALEITADGISAVALPFALRLRPAAAEALGDGAAHGSVAPGRHPERGARAPLAAVCVLSRSRSSRAAPAVRMRPAAAFVALLPHAYCFGVTTERKRRMLERYSEVAARVPVLELPVSGDIAGLAATLDAAERVVTRAS